MDALSEFLEHVRRLGVAQHNLLGLWHILIGRRIERKDGLLIGEGVTWRALAQILKKVRWDPDLVTELSIDPAGLPPRDRERFWYSAIARAGVDSHAAAAAGDALAKSLQNHGYIVGPAPRR